jgi:hypothetical protein
MRSGPFSKSPTIELSVTREEYGRDSTGARTYYSSAALGLWIAYPAFVKSYVSKLAACQAHPTSTHCRLHDASGSHRIPALDPPRFSLTQAVKIVDADHLSPRGSQECAIRTGLRIGVPDHVDHQTHKDNGPAYVPGHRRTSQGAGVSGSSG